MSRAWLRSRLGRLGPLRSGYAFALATRQALTWSGAGVEPWLNRTYATAEDPWNYASNPEEAARHHAALALIEEAFGDRRPRALEIGCGEGMFTAELSTRCDSVLAADIAPLALSRAQARCAALGNVRVVQWHLLDDEPIGTFELVVCMDTISHLPPLARGRAAARVARAVAPGGRLVLSEVLVAPIVESSWWDRWLLTSAAHIIGRFGRAGVGLDLEGTRRTDRHLLARYAAADTDRRQMTAGSAGSRPPL